MLVSLFFFPNKLLEPFLQARKREKRVVSSAEKKEENKRGKQQQQAINLAKGRLSSKTGWRRK